MTHNDIHNCHPQCDRPICVAVREAIAAEREACAEACEQKSAIRGGEIFAARIRARGQPRA